MAPAGRPKIGKEKRIRVNVMLDPNTHAYLKALGDGNVSSALHLILIHHMAQKIHDIVFKPKKAKRRSVNQGAKQI
jgi:hypothetical protein